MMFQLLGILSALLFIAADIPYIVGIVRGHTKPQRVTWGVVVVLNVIGFANQFASGAKNSLWIFGAASLLTGAIFLLSLWRGVGGRSRLDIFSLVISLGGVGLWVLSGSPKFSIVVNILVGFVALLPTFAKAKKQPETETKITWLLGTVSVLLAAISVGELNFWLLILPVSSTLLQAYMVYILYIEAPRKSKLQH